MQINLIAAMDRCRAIGWQNQLPWHLPDDLRFFKSQTQGGVVVMGRKTYESLGCRPLPNRRNVVLTRQAHWSPSSEAEVARDWQNLQGQLTSEGVGDVWVIGGGDVYALCLPEATSLVLTHVDTVLPHADTWFPDWSGACWTEECVGEHGADERHCFSFRWVKYTQVPPTAQSI